MHCPLPFPRSKTAILLPLINLAITSGLDSNLSAPMLSQLLFCARGQLAFDASMASSREK